MVQVLTKEKDRTFEKGKTWVERSDKVTTRSQSNLKSALKIMDRPLFFEKGKGARLWDVDGNEYVDFSNSAGASILGHNHPEYIQALKDQLDKCYTLTSGMVQSTLEVELAEKIVAHVPCAEKVRFCVTGSEAVQLVLRLARAHTGRQKFIRFEGHYHGGLDNVFGGIVNPDPSAKPFALDIPEDPLSTGGREKNAFQQSFLIPWNDIPVLEDTLKKYGDEIALIIMEPFLVNGECCAPRPGYLQKVRELCNQYGVVLCFDEVITGFRTGLSGMQGQVGVTPDIATFGKALAAGFPVSAVAGKKEIMSHLEVGDVVGAGTFNGSPIGMAAALATLKVLEKDNGAIYQKIDATQARLTAGLKEISKRHNTPCLIQGPRGVFFYLFSDKEVAHSVSELADLDWGKHMAFLHRMVEEGVLMMFFTRWYISAAVEKADVDFALEAADRVLSKI